MHKRKKCYKIGLTIALRRFRAEVKHMTQKAAQRDLLEDITYPSSHLDQGVVVLSQTLPDLQGDLKVQLPVL